MLLPNGVSAQRIRCCRYPSTVRLVMLGSSGTAPMVERGRERFRDASRRLVRRSGTDVAAESIQGDPARIGTVGILGAH